MKTHLNLSTTDLAQSVAFYSTLLDAKPAKAFSDYALFVTEHPALELALDRVESVSPTEDAHYGIFVENIEDLERATARLQRAGLALSIEHEETCCYAKQSKVWTIDPEGRRWEVYAVHEDTTDRNDHNAKCCKRPDEANRACCAFDAVAMERPL